MKMDLTPVFVVQLIVCLTGVMTQPLKISANAPDAVKLPHSDVTISCVVDRTRTRSNIVWTRRVGKLTMGIGFNNFIYDTDHVRDEDSRYKLSISGSTENKVTYTLTIKDLSVTDTATIGCKLQSAATDLSVNHILVVCEDPTSASCKCLLKTGFLTPTCFEEPPSMQSVRSSYKTTIYGLTACLVIVILFGIAMAVLAGRDCMAALNAKRQRHMAKLRGNGDATSPRSESQALSRDTESEISDTVPDRIVSDRQTTNQYAHLLSTQTHQNPAFAAEETDAAAEQPRYEEVDASWRQDSQQMAPPCYRTVLPSDVTVVEGARPKTNGYANKPSPLVLNARAAGIAHDRYSPNRPREQNQSPTGAAHDRYSPNRPREQNQTPYQRPYSAATARSPAGDSYTSGNHTPHTTQASIHSPSAYQPRSGGEISPRGYNGRVRNAYTDPPRDRKANHHWREPDMSAQPRGRDTNTQPRGRDTNTQPRERDTNTQPKRLDFVYGHAQPEPYEDDSGPYIDKRDMIV